MIKETITYSGYTAGKSFGKRPLRRDFTAGDATVKDFVGEARRRVLFSRAMTRLKIIVASALLVLWLPATSFCLAENVGLIPTGRCCDERTPADASPCCVVASAAYKLDDNSSLILPYSCHALGCLTINGAPLERISFALNGDSPPEIRSSWQFSSRAAASPRAPSFAS
jgi:hypothetical protein